MTDLGSLGGNSWASAFNNNGVIGGRSELDPEQPGVVHPWVWKNGTMTALELPESTLGYVSDVTEQGVVLGAAFVGFTLHHGLIWRDGTVTRLASLVPAGAGWNFAAPRTNEAGLVVAFANAGHYGTGMLLTPAAPPEPADVSITLSATPTSVPYQGQIVVTATVTNNGPNTATGVYADIEYPSGNLGFVSADPAQGGNAARAGNDVHWDDLSLPPGASVSVRLVLRGNKAGTYTLAAYTGSFNDYTPQAVYPRVTVTVEAAPPVDLTVVWPRLDLRRQGSSRAVLSGDLQVVGSAEGARTETFLVNLYLSSDAEYSAEDVYMGSLEIKDLSIPGRRAAQWSLRGNPALFEGKYVVAEVDSQGTVEETDENNAFARQVRERGRR